MIPTSNRKNEANIMAGLPVTVVFFRQEPHTHTAAGFFPTIDLISYACSTDGCVMVPKGEPKVEPVSDIGLYLANDAPMYHQMMNTLPLEPQMLLIGLILVTLSLLCVIIQMGREALWEH